MRLFLFVAMLIPPYLPLQAQTPETAEAIMARVAQNQDRSDAERAHFVYLQHARVRSLKGKTIRCEEVTDTRITPAATGSSSDLLKLDGRLLVKQKYLTYTRLPVHKPGNKAQAHDVEVTLDETDSMDRDLVENMRDNLTNRKSRDGIAAGLFPLTSASQSHYRFRMVGREPMNGRDTFHVAFEPMHKDDFDWKGDAYIDTTAYQPVLVRTAMARNIPFAVRTLLGTSLPDSASPSSTRPRKAISGFPSALARNSNCTSSSSLTGRSSSEPKIVISKRPTSPRSSSLRLSSPSRCRSEGSRK